MNTISSIILFKVYDILESNFFPNMILKIEVQVISHHNIICYKHLREVVNCVPVGKAMEAKIY